MRNFHKVPVVSHFFLYKKEFFSFLRKFLLNLIRNFSSNSKSTLWWIPLPADTEKSKGLQRQFFSLSIFQTLRNTMQDKTRQGKAYIEHKNSKQPQQRNYKTNKAPHRVHLFNLILNILYCVIVCFLSSSFFFFFISFQYTELQFHCNSILIKLVNLKIIPISFSFSLSLPLLQLIVLCKVSHCFVERCTWARRCRCL